MYNASLDIEKAFAQLEAWAVERSLLARSAPGRATVGQQAWPTMTGVTCEAPNFDRAGGLGRARRGGGMWLYVVSAFTKPLVGEWKSQGTLAWCLDLGQWLACAEVYRQRLAHR